jgi:hypothetical protein
MHLQLQLHTDRMPRNRTILEFEFSDTTRDEARFWIVVTERKADVCIQPAGEASVCPLSTRRTTAQSP